jgi:hypothetical protein
MGMGEASKGFWCGNLREGDLWGDPGVDGKIIRIIMDVQEVGCGDMDWIELAQDRDRRQVFVNAVMNLRVS